MMVKADVELGGTDQLFNILVGRDLQREEGSRSRSSFLLPILEGLDGVKKMSKSLGNYVARERAAYEMFGKLMSISDEMMARYYPLLLGRDTAGRDASVGGEKAARARNRRDVSHGRRGQKAARRMERRFSEKRLDQADLPEFSPPNDTTSAVPVVVAAYGRASA